MGSCVREAGSPKTCLSLPLAILGVIILEREKPWGGRRSHCCPAWALGSHDNLLLPKFPRGAQHVWPRLLQPHSEPFTLVSAKLLSCHSSTGTLSAARSLAELGTKGVLGVEVPACPKPHWICCSECPLSIPQTPHTSLCLHCLPWSRGFPRLCHVFAEIPHPGVPAGSPKP